MKSKLIKKYAAVLSAITLAFGMAAPMQNLYAEEAVPRATEQANGQAAEDTFSVFKGKVTSINSSSEKTMIRIEDENKAPIDFVLDEGSVIVDEKGIIAVKDLKEGDKITSYYIMPEAVIMIYPQQYKANVLVKLNEESPKNVYVGVFDENLLSSKGDLKLNINEENPIVDTKGVAYDAEQLANKPLVIFYSFQTMSIPAQTSPDKILVLDELTSNTDVENEKNVPPAIDETGGQQPLDKIILENVPKMQIFANNMHVKAPAAYLTDNEVIMLPLRAVAEAFGYKIGWDEATRSVTVGNGMTLTIGQDSYILGKRVPIKLGTAPQIKDDLTYVPLSYFTEVMQIDLRIDEGIFNFSNPIE